MFMHLHRRSEHYRARAAGGISGDRPPRHGDREDWKKENPPTPGVPKIDKSRWLKHASIKACAEAGDIVMQSQASTMPKAGAEADTTSYNTAIKASAEARDMVRAEYR